MSERTRLVAEAFGHWVLAWTLVVLAVGLWSVVLRPRRASVRYGGWLLATFAGAALLPMVVAVGPRVSWSELIAPTPSRSWTYRRRRGRRLRSAPGSRTRRASVRPGRVIARRRTTPEDVESHRRPDDQPATPPIVQTGAAHRDLRGIDG